MKAKNRVLWRHSIVVGKHRYTLLCAAEQLSLREGDLVEFRWSWIRKSHYSFRGVVGMPAVVCKREEQGGARGVIYVMSNPTFANVYKVGITSRPVEERRRELSDHSGVPTSFRVEWTKSVRGNLAAIESAVHHRLREKNVGKEFFAENISVLRQTITDVCVALEPPFEPEHCNASYAPVTTNQVMPPIVRSEGDCEYAGDEVSDISRQALLTAESGSLAVHDRGTRRPSSDQGSSWRGWLLVLICVAVGVLIKAIRSK